MKTTNRTKPPRQTTKQIALRAGALFVAAVLILVAVSLVTGEMQRRNACQQAEQDYRYEEENNMMHELNMNSLRCMKHFQFGV